MCQICINTSSNDKLRLIKNLEKHKYLYCSRCPVISIIPKITMLVELSCSNCLSLTEIPKLDSLEYLDCSNCPLLTEISHIEKLKMLDCSNCPSLKKLPNFKNLTQFNYIQFSKELIFGRYILSWFLYKFKIPIKSRQLFKIKLEQYADYILDEYVNPKSLYMQFYINNSCYDNIRKNTNSVQIGYISCNKHVKELKLLTFK